MKYILIFLSFLTSVHVRAQSDATNKWSFSVGGGLAMPVGKFGKVDVLEIASVQDGEYLLGDYFEKEGHGAARIGYFLEASIKRQIFSHFLVSLNVFQTKNRVSTSEINAFYDIVLWRDFQYHIFTQDDYSVFAAYAGLGYAWKFNNWSANIQPSAGTARMVYPEYTLSYYWDESYGDQAHTLVAEAKHRGSTLDPTSFVYGISTALSITLNRHLYFEISAKYMAANFNYTIEPKIGGVDSRELSDVVNYRIFNLGLSIGMAF